jgi:DNA-binding phage protein
MNQRVFQKIIKNKNLGGRKLNSKDLKKLKGLNEKGKYLTQALKKEDPEEMQLMFQDVIRANGGMKRIAKKAHLSEWRLQLILKDSEEAWKIKRFQEIIQALGLRLVIQ